MRALMVCLLFSCAASKPQAPAEAAPGDPPPALAAAECQADADCALTHVPENNCCPNLCVARVVTAKHAAELQSQAASCGRPCPRMSCAPPRFRIVPACSQGRCISKSVRQDD
ncbi:MAG TPA: hypothetical protein VLW85_14260 [Myxococcales bacterium]|nr:hypothetical protein [Myxococcales bacterium]